MDLERWHYFLSIERDFIATTDFVHVAPANFKTFSNEYAKLLLLIGSEFDVVAKMLCDAISPSSSAQNIHEYAKIIIPRFTGINGIEVEIPRYQLKRQPLSTWTPGLSPKWWPAYNHVKHERDLYFAEANLENTLDALCGLMALLLYHYKDEGHLQPYPVLLNYGFPEHIVTEGGQKPPGI